MSNIKQSGNSGKVIWKSDETDSGVSEERVWTKGKVSEIQSDKKEVSGGTP